MGPGGVTVNGQMNRIVPDADKGYLKHVRVTGELPMWRLGEEHSRKRTANIRTKAWELTWLV